MKSSDSDCRATVLVVEDDPTLLRGLCDAFSGCGYLLKVACDGDSAVAMALDEPPDVIVLDIMLPGFNGFEVCEIVRETNPELPIVMLSARGNEADVIRGLELGADDYITKPFSIAELRARVKAALRRGGASPLSKRFSFGAFNLDADRRELRREGVGEVSLTGQEFEVLVYFLGRPGRVVTRDMLLRSVWKRPLLASATRTVDRCVANLRSKIETDPSRPGFLVTVRWVGYRFDPGGG